MIKCSASSNKSKSLDRACENNAIAEVVGFLFKSVQCKILFSLLIKLEILGLLENWSKLLTIVYTLTDISFTIKL